VFRDADYTLGIFQTIGFKEFHDYLLLSAEEKQTARGRKLLQEGQVMSNEPVSALMYIRKTFSGYTSHIHNRV